MSNIFKLENLGSMAIKEVLNHLSNKDKCKLLLCCKRWNLIITPMLWENINLDSNIYHYEYDREMKKVYRKYGHFIKSLNLGKWQGFPNHPSTYPNCSKLYLLLNNYLYNRENLNNSCLEGVCYTDYVGNMTIKEYINLNKINIKKVFQNLRYLELRNFEDYFTISILPILPPTISSLNISNNSNQGVPYFIKVINKFDNLRIFKLENVILELEEYRYLRKKQFPQLRKLHIGSIEVRTLGFEDTYIDLNNYPKLESFYHVSFYSTLILDGVSNLRELKLYRFDLSKISISNKSFPKLNQLCLKSCSDIPSCLLYSIFSMPTITCLDLDTYHNKSLSLVKEIYPKKKSNIITLKIDGSILGTEFFHFLYTSCPILYRLEISYSHFNTDLPFLDFKIKGNSNLTHVLFEHIQCSSSITMIDFILIHFKNISSFEAVDCESSIKAKYINNPKFYFIRQ
ncbi:hypothetical protein K502DRAFT_363637 [Neoconidiobolus thromboides FSU 785]|nr:hypothetical protein K502DRAFT_363637 [Neoconidiobolus thromboides FSU 785]